MKITRDEFIMRLVEAAEKASAAPAIMYDRVFSHPSYNQLIIVVANDKERCSIRDLKEVDIDKWEVVFVGKDNFPFSDLFEIEEDGSIFWCGNFVDRNWKIPFSRK